jgi:hypothetical protein
LPGLSGGWPRRCLLPLIPIRRRETSRRAPLGSDGRSPRGRPERTPCRERAHLVACPAQTVLVRVGNPKWYVWSLRRAHCRRPAKVRGRGLTGPRLGVPRRKGACRGRRRGTRGGARGGFSKCALTSGRLCRQSRQRCSGPSLGSCGRRLCAARPAVRRDSPTGTRRRRADLTGFVRSRGRPVRPGHPRPSPRSSHLPAVARARRSGGVTNLRGSSGWSRGPQTGDRCPRALS